MDNLFGGGLWDLLGQGHPQSGAQELQRQQAMQVGFSQPSVFHNCAFTGGSETADSSLHPKAVLTGITEYGYDPSTKETAVAWLDRRVEEMRVKL